MTEQPRRDPAADARLIAEARERRSQRYGGVHPRASLLSHEHLDALLAAVDERDALKRQLVGEPAEPWRPLSGVYVAPAGSPPPLMVNRETLPREYEDNPGLTL